MRNLYVVGMIVVIIGAMSAGGCMVEKSKLDKANSLNRKLSDQLKGAERDKDELLAENEDLLAQLEAHGPVDEQVAILVQQNQDLQMKYDDLYMRYEEQLNKTVVLPEPVNLALQELAASMPDVLEFSEQYGMVKLRADLTFAKGSVDVKPAAFDALSRLAGIVNSTGASAFNVYIAGHTDDVPIVQEATKRRHPNNWYLSVHRAVEVEKVLTDAGVDPTRVAVIGFGQFQPVEANAEGNKGNAANRRVEIWLVPKGQFVTVR